MPTQLPNDAVAAGYKETRPYHHEQVFRSESAAFTGTEREFVEAGHGYEYDQTTPHTRSVTRVRSLGVIAQEANVLSASEFEQHLDALDDDDEHTSSPRP